MGRYLDIIRRAEAEIDAPELSDKSDQSDKSDKTAVLADRRSDFGRFGRFGRNPSALDSELATLERQCPEHVELDRWQQAIADGRRFLTRWGDQAAALGWTASDLFGLHRLPENPGPTYRRLSRYDETGLVWLLSGAAVVALTEVTAAIQNAAGVVTTYRKHHKPPLGPFADSLDDLK